MNNCCNNSFITGCSLHINKGIIVFDLVTGINSFSKSGEISVFVKIRGFTDENRRIIAGFRAFRNKNDILFDVQFIEL